MKALNVSDPLDENGESAKKEIVRFSANMVNLGKNLKWLNPGLNLRACAKFKACYEQA